MWQGRKGRKERTSPRSGGGVTELVVGTEQDVEDKIAGELILVNVESVLGGATWGIMCSQGKTVANSAPCVKACIKRDNDSRDDLEHTS